MIQSSIHHLMIQSSIHYLSVVLSHCLLFIVCVNQQNLTIDIPVVPYIWRNGHYHNIFTVAKKVRGNIISESDPVALYVSGM